jgi:hypothetical protein
LSAKATIKTADKFSSEIAEVMQVKMMPYSLSIDSALKLLPKSVTNMHLLAFGGHGRKDVKGDCWAFQIHDTDQLVGKERAARHIKCLRLPFEIGQQPMIVLEKAIADRFCEFGASHIATPAMAICVTALKCKIGRTTDDDLWPALVQHGLSGYIKDD